MAPGPRFQRGLNMQTMQKYRLAFLAICVFAFTGCSHSDTSSLIAPDGTRTSSDSQSQAKEWWQDLSANPGTDKPVHIHLSWQDDTQSTMTITWQTQRMVQGAVEYGTLGMQTAREKDQRLPHTYAGASGWIHEVKLNDLKPDSLYHYRCGNETTGWSAIQTFHTGVLPGNEFAFIVFGDTRTKEDIRVLVKNKIMTENASFSLHTGDLIDKGSNQGLWDAWFTQMEDLMSVSPLIPCLGNHEADPFGFGFSPKYYAQFALPDTPSCERWYSFDFGNAHFIVLNSEERLFQIAKGSVQYRWLEDDLKNTQAKWKFVMFHRPPYSAGGHGSDEFIMENWCPLFDAYDVDMVFAGHNHIYERTYPIKAGTVDPEGTVYIVSGGGGAPLYELNNADWVAEHNRTYHYCRIDVLSDYELRLKVNGLKIDAEDNPVLDENQQPIWELIDESTMVKTP